MSYSFKSLFSLGVGMPFPESLKVKIRKRANIRCCIYHSFGVEVHHIVPEAMEGANTEDNAAPLCPSCHEIYGANPQKRKLIREARDIWYERCEQEYGTNTKLKEISDTLQNLPTKEGIQHLAVRNTRSEPESSETQALSPLTYNRYSFVGEEFINPLIIRELLGWLSDRGEAICSVDLVSANRSNRFPDAFEVNKRDGKIWVEWKSRGRESFVYSYIATSPSGVEIIACYDWGGGSAIFGSVGLFCFGYDRALAEDSDGKISTRERIILKSLGSIALGDRYKGELKYKDGFLEIGPDIGWFNRGHETSRKLPIL